MSSSNVVLANVYGRAPSGAMRPLLVTESGGLLGELPPEEIVPWTIQVGLNALTPLVAFTPFGDDCKALLFGMKTLFSGLHPATFFVETSEDGATPAKGHGYVYELARGEHDVWESDVPLLRRFFRLSAKPSVNGGPSDVAWMVRRLVR
jgi:hypothetical protein